MRKLALTIGAFFTLAGPSARAALLYFDLAGAPKHIEDPTGAVLDEFTLAAEIQLSDEDEAEFVLIVEGFEIANYVVKQNETVSFTIQTGSGITHMTEDAYQVYALLKSPCGDVKIEMNVDPHQPEEESEEEIEGSSYSQLLPWMF